LLSGGSGNEPAAMEWRVIAVAPAVWAGVWMEDYLNEELPSFYTSDLSAIEGTSIFRSPA